MESGSGRGGNQPRTRQESPICRSRATNRAKKSDRLPLLEVSLDEDGFSFPMELSSSLFHLSKISPSDLSFSTSLSPFPIQIHLKRPKSKHPIYPISAVSIPPQETDQRNSPQRLLKELSERKKAAFPKKKIPPRKFILKPPLDDGKLAQRFLDSPQLSLKAFPLLSSCLPPARLNNADKTWIDEYLLEAKQALGYPLEPSDRFGDDNPAKQFDTLLYLAFQYPSCDRTRARHVRIGHSRLLFLGQFVLELALAEYFLQRYPRESPGPMRERVYALIGKRYLPKWIKAASLQNLVFPFDEIDKLRRKEREPPVKSVFWALFGAIYLCFGMPEVYRVLFEAFGMDLEDESCQPRLRRQLEDVDYVSVEFEGKQLSWQDVATYRPPEDALFAHPRLFRACVPPGMHRFRGNIWDYDSRPLVMQALGYPLSMNDKIPEITEARNIELGLGLQLSFLHPSKYKFEHPRFCNERLEYLGQKIQVATICELGGGGGRKDLVMAERLLMKHLDAPGYWLQEKHRRLLMNKFCGRYLRDRHLHHFMIYSEQVLDAYERNRRLRNPATSAVQQAIHGLAYTVYGKPDVRRLMFDVFDFEQIQPKTFTGSLGFQLTGVGAAFRG
ncbi:RNA-binding protein that suppresses calcineurin Rnc1 [Asimina triloba]